MSPSPHANSSEAPLLWRADQYQGESAVRVAATQLEQRAPSATERRRILDEWITFFATADTAVTRLEFASRVPQELLDAISGQAQMREIQVEWCPYRDVSALGNLSELTVVHLGGATRLERLLPLRRLPRLRELTVSEGHRVEDRETLGRLTTLRSLTYGNGSLGSNKNVVLPDLRWVRSLTELRALALPGTRLLDGDLSPLLKLPKLERLVIPLRRQFRKQVIEFAEFSPVFAAVAAEYDEYETWRRRLRG